MSKVIVLQGSSTQKQTYLAMQCVDPYNLSFLMISPPFNIPLIFWDKTEYSLIQAIFIAPLQVHYYSEALPTQHGYCVRISRQSATGNCKQRTCPRSLHGG